MAKQKHFVVTASFTDDGGPAYMTEGHSWSRKLADAVVVDSEDAAEELLGLARGQEALICDPYAIKARRTDAGVETLAVKEVIRAKGPTTPIRRADSPSTG